MASAVVLDLMGGVALLLWGLHMVRSGIMRAFGSELRCALSTALRNRFLALLAGIGNPEAFRQTVVRLGGNVVAFRQYPDHHAYTRADVEELRTWARRQATDCVFVTTQKDLVKLRLARLGDHELWALRIRLFVSAGQKALDRKLKEALG